jgi:general secretion pathway protein D
MKFIKIGVVISLLLCSVVVAKEITINFQNTPVMDVVKFVATKTNKNILINEPISGNVNFISNLPIQESELISLLEHVLMVKGYALSPSAKGYYEIVRSATASKNVTLGDKSDVGMKMVILRPKNAKPSVIVDKIKHLASQYAIITHDDKMGILLVSDYPKNIKNMKRLLNLFDTQLKRELRRVELKNTNVKDAMTKLQAIFDATKDSYVDVVSLMSDEYQNALWVSANSEDMQRVLDFIDRYENNAKDLSIMSTKIVFLKNANVEDIVKTAQDIATSKDKDKPVKSVITSNKELNALVISSTVSQINELVELISQLDIERRQVFVKVQIYEVSQNALDQMGIKWGAGAGMAQDGIIATTNIAMGGSAFALPEALTTAGALNLGEIDKAVAIGATIDFLQSSGAVDVISEPNLLSVNNVKSSIYVGKTQSILTSDATGSNSLDVTRNSYTREDIGLTLEITPQIADDDNVVLKILINIEDIDDSTEADRPTTTKRKVDTTAIVRNEDSILIGGLIRNSYSNSESKVPLLGDIPFLGGLFRHNTDSHDKIATIMSITPYIITSSKDLQEMQKKLNHLNLLKKQLSDKLKEEMQLELNKEKKNQINEDPLGLNSQKNDY